MPYTAPPPDSPANPLLRAEEAAALLGISKRFLQILQARGDIRPVRLGPKAVRYPAAEISRYATQLFTDDASRDTDTGGAR